MRTGAYRHVADNDIGVLQPFIRLLQQSQSPAAFAFTYLLDINLI